MIILHFITVCMCLQFFISMNSVLAQESKEFGKQVWMTTNLSVNTFRNGDTILHAKTPKQWIDAAQKGIPAWCYYDNDKQNGEIHGALYNYHAVLDSRGLAPQGWHIPDVKEWKELFNQFGGDNEAGFALLSRKHWFVSEWNPPIEVEPSGFEAFGSGAIDYQGNFYDKDKIIGYYTLNNELLPVTITSTEPSEDGQDKVEVSVEYESPKVEVYFLNNLTTMIGKYSIQGNEGYSVRCIKD